MHDPIVPTRAAPGAVEAPTPLPHLAALPAGADYLAGFPAATSSVRTARAPLPASRSSGRLLRGVGGATPK
jgi:hypothetical protein